MPSETTRFGNQELTVRRLAHPALSTQQCAALQTLAAIVALADACATTWLLAAGIAACLTLARPLGTGVRWCLAAFHLPRGRRTAVDA
ncbi:hypothetical protein ACIHDR_32885 [Nocardia sp. NPDC052278]|uniref:hypothetical protein n=1 Tax=unclassified Nocardia TaxID=2637762 RepID=UPI003695D0FA